MNTFKIAFFSLLITSISASAQGYGNQRNGYGSNRDVGRNYSDNKPSAEEIEKNKAAQLDKFMSKMKADLTLDDLQFIAIKNEITANNKAIEVVIKKGNSEEEKTEEIKALMEKSELNITSYLNASQKEKFKILKEEMKSPKKKKKSKKKNDLENEQ